MNQLLGKEAIIVGAGISGLTAAIALQSLGMKVRIYESSSSLRTSGSGLSVMANAIAALKTLGIEGLIESAGQPIRHFDIKSSNGKKISSFPLYSVGVKLGNDNVNVHRQRLHDALRSKIKGDVIELDKPFSHYTQDVDGVTAYFSDDSKTTADILLGADGVHSAVRKQLAGATKLNNVPYIVWLATVPYQFPQFDPGYVAHYWGAGQRFGLIDIGHSEYYWWGTQNCRNPKEALKHCSKEEILNAYQGWAPEISEIINATPSESILKVHTRDRQVLDSWTDRRVALIGDAAHPMLTSLGQGAGQGIEDGAVLANCLANANNIISGLNLYEKNRLPRANKIVNLARNLSSLEQVENRLLVNLRDTYFKWTPQSVFEKQNLDILSFSLPFSSLTRHFPQIFNGTRL